MSRTERFRKGKFIPWWNDYDWRNWVEIKDGEEIDPTWDVRHNPGYGNGGWYERSSAPATKEGRANYWKMHKDAKFNFKEPGPHWFRNMDSDRPLRRHSKNELRKFMFNKEYEPVISRYWKLDYWT